MTTQKLLLEHNIILNNYCKADKQHDHNFIQRMLYLDALVFVMVLCCFYCVISFLQL